MWVHFNPTSGEIVGWEHSTEPPRLAGTEYISVADDFVVGGKTHRVDTVKRKIVSKTKKERAAAQAPSLFAVKQVIFSELQHSDVTQIADYPIGTELRAQWASYRQALRDLSKHHATAQAMLDAWPTRPDDADVAAQYRALLGPR